MNIYEDGIYKVVENDYVYGEKNERGKAVKVVKGRKFPIGAEYVINGFWRDDWGHIFAFMKSGEKINIDNIRLVEPVVEKSEIMFHYNGNGCPHCHSKNIVWIGESFDPGWDEYYNNYVCNDCGARSKCSVQEVY